MNLNDPVIFLNGGRMKTYLKYIYHKSWPKALIRMQICADGIASNVHIVKKAYCMSERQELFIL